MANDKRRDRSGRVTPKRGAAGPASGGAGGAGGAGGTSGRRPVGRRRLPARIGPFARPDAGAAPGQVGRRPSSPAKLLVFALVYIACGVIALVVIKGSLRLVLGIVFIGVGLLWLRGAATAAVRHERRDKDG